MRYFLHIGFDGSAYHGWQWQPNVISVQQTIEDALLRILKYKITAYGCGRTDTGVHGSQYIMHINLEDAPTFDLKFRLNKNLPADIVIYEVIAVKEDQHCRYDATSRTYDYFIHLYKDPVLSRYSSYYEYEDLDFESMVKAANILSNYSDFRSLCKQPDLYKHTSCQVTFAKLYVDKDQKRLRFSIKSDRFLRSMVRLSVYFLLQIGTRQMTFEAFEYMLANQLDIKWKHPAYADGLYLTKVEYPYLSIDRRNDFCQFLMVGLTD